MQSLPRSLDAGGARAGQLAAHFRRTCSCTGAESMSSTAKPGYQTLQETIEELTQLLGGQNFCRVALAKTAVDFVKDPVGKRLGGYSATVGLYPGHLLLATDDELLIAASALRHIVTFQRPEPATMTSDSIYGAAIKLRGSSVLYETANGSVCLAHAYRNDHAPDSSSPWSAVLSDVGEIFVRHFPGAEEPARTIVHCKTEEAARATLVRFVEKSFRIPLKAQHPETSA
jgi:hypothetical protein